VQIKVVERELSEKDIAERKKWSGVRIMQKLTCGRPLDEWIWSCYELTRFIHHCSRSCGCWNITKYT